MPTIQEEKSTKPRQRSRKADRRKAKNEPKMEARSESDAVSSVADAVNSIEAPIEAGVVEAAPAAISVEPAVEVIHEIVLSGEVLPPNEREHVAPQTAGLQAIAQAYGDYTRKSWATGRFLVERMITVRSFDEAVEIQGEFARQACANFAVESQKMCTLYGAWAQHFVRPLEKFAAQWPRIGR
jgi:hypothetical protein